MPPIPHDQTSPHPRPPAVRDADAEASDAAGESEDRSQAEKHGDLRSVSGRAASGGNTPSAPS